ncbi:Golgi-associated plant pathogenesis-related protein 1-like [Anneissia japonica]|uniref:Golgi-associated plant pathogenesis-related protein 1-like n=1 Tax=Anneissia japonica TaxID=1529436 RepID=UPI001425B49D|nr:Golgi-associated plant pathogenesis-related protein 1-like [Anneissia japonica]
MNQNRFDELYIQISKSEQKQFQQEALTTHNEYRVKHGVPKLTASEDLNKHSQKWAEHLAKTGKFEHSEQRQYGENIAMHYSSETTDYSGRECSNHWYSELRNYDFNNPAFSQGTGKHFT